MMRGILKTFLIIMKMRTLSRGSSTAYWKKIEMAMKTHIYFPLFYVGVYVVMALFLVVLCPSFCSAQFDPDDELEDFSDIENLTEEEIKEILSKEPRIIIFPDENNNENLSPLDIAVREAVQTGDLEWLKSLVADGADLKKCHDPLYVAAEHGHLEMVKYLVQQGIRSAPDKEDIRHWDILHDAIPHVEVIRFLKSQGYNWRFGYLWLSDDLCYHYPLKPGEELFFHTNSVETISFFINDFGMDIDTVDANGRSLLHNAIRRTCKTIGELEEYQCQIPKDKTYDPKTPNSFDYSFWTLAVFLMEQGADFHLQDKFGKRPIQYATEHYFDMIRVAGYPQELFERRIWKDAEVRRNGGRGNPVLDKYFTKKEDKDKEENHNEKNPQ